MKIVYLRLPLKRGGQGANIFHGAPSRGSLTLPPSIQGTLSARLLKSYGAAH